MAVPEQTPYIEHTGNGVTTSFSLKFQCESKDHLIVLIDDIEPPIASWSLVGGNVVFTTAPAAGKKITLQRNTPFSRTTDYQSYNNSFRPPAVNKDFDWIWLKLQELGVANWLLKQYVDKKDDELKAFLLEEIRKQGVALDQLDKYYNYLMQQLAQIAVNKGWLDSFVTTWSGRTQESKNKDTVSALDFGIIPNSLEDQTSKFDNFFNYIRTNKVKGTAPAGTYIVSPTKQKVFGSVVESNLETVNYCIDISGVDFEGAVAGYRNAQGTIFKINPLSTDTKAVVMLQAQQTASLITYNIKGVAFRNAPVCLRMTYAVHCNIDHMYADNTCKDFIVLGDFSFTSGPLFNKFSNVNCSVLGKPLAMQGKNWCNANIFENFYLSGGEPSSIVVTGGYGAIANTFIGGEFASTAVGSHGIVLGRVSATSFYNTYFEPQGHAIVFDGLSRSTLLSNCTYGTTNSSKTEGVNPSILHHRGLFNAEVIIDGGVLFFNASNPLQANMTMLSTANASQVSLHVPKQPVLGGGNPSYKLITPDVLRNLRVFRGLYSDTQPLEFYTAGASISNLPTTSRMDVNISGSSCTVSFRLDMSNMATYEDGTYYLKLPRARPESTLSSIGVLVAYDVLGLSEQMMGYIRATSSGNLEASILKPTATSVYDDVTKTVETTIRNQRAELDKVFLQSLGNNGYVQGTLTYSI